MKTWRIGNGKDKRRLKKKISKIDEMKYIKKLTAKKDDPTLMSKEEFFKRIDDARKGKTFRMKPEESLDEFFRNLDEAERDIADGKGIEMLPNETLDDLLKRVG